MTMTRHAEITYVFMILCLSSTGLTGASLALLGDATDNVIYPQEHDSALYRGFDCLHLHVM